MRVIIALFFALLSLSSYGQKAEVKFRNIRSGSPEYAATLLYADGIKYMLQGKADTATIIFQEVLEINPEHSAACYQMAVLNEVSAPAAMLEYARKAYESDKLNSDFSQIYIRSLFANNKLDEARKLLTDLRNQPTNRRQNYFLSIILANQMGDDVLVVELAKFYLEKWGFAPVVTDIYIEKLIKKGQFTVAEELLSSYIRENSGEPALVVMLAKVKASCFKDEEAVDLFKNAVALDSTNHETWLAFSDYYRLKRDTPNYLLTIRPVFDSKILDPKTKADYFERTFFDPALLKENYLAIQQIAMSMYASDPANDNIDKAYTRFLMFTGDIKLAKTLLHNRIAENHANAETFNSIISIEDYSKRYDSVVYYSKMAVKQFPDDMSFRLMTASGQWQGDKPTEALATLKQVMKIADTDSLRSDIKAFEGDILYKMGKQSKAFAAYDRALSYNSDNAALLNNYAYYLSLEKLELERALTLSRRANTIDEGNPTFLDTEAWILYELGRYEEARTVQRRAIALSSERSGELLLHYGDILFKLNEPFLAETYWKKALEKGADSQKIEERLRQLK